MSGRIRDRSIDKRDGARALMEMLPRLEHADVSLVGEHSARIMQLIVRAAHDVKVTTENIFKNFFRDVQEKMLSYRHDVRQRFGVVRPRAHFVHDFIYNGGFVPSLVYAKLFEEVQKDLDRLLKSESLTWLQAGYVHPGTRDVDGVRIPLLTDSVCARARVTT